MSKITLSLTSGTTIEKPLITAFRGSMGEYVVLDNEANGTMGLPIILVSKIVNNKLSKIEDQNEWGTVKEILRNIISGNQIDYITVPNNLSGDDIFYSQLTLPIASFDALKNNYKPMVSGEAPMPSAPVPPMPNVSSVGPIASAPAPVATPAPAPTTPTPTPAPTMEATPSFTPVGPEPAVVSPVTPAPVAIPEMPIPPVAPAMPEVAPVMPSAPSEPVSASEPTPVVPEVASAPTPMPTPTPEPAPVPSAPVVEPIPASPKKVDYQADKEAFLKACENMFDALVAKFNE